MLVMNRGDGLLKWLSDEVPRTSHPLNEAAKWVYDVVELETVAGMGRVLLTVHGEFKECKYRTSRGKWAPLMAVCAVPNEALRSFSRVFVLGIAVAGSV